MAFPVLPIVNYLLNLADKLLTDDPGVIETYAGSTSPRGWVECDGRALDSTFEPSIFVAIGTRYGDGSTGIGSSISTDFNIPDLRGRFIRGWDHGAGNDPDVGIRTASAAGGTTDAVNDVGTLQGSALSSHQHTYQERGTSATGGGAETVSLGNTSTTGSEGITEVRPMNISLMYIIKI